MVVWKGTVASLFLVAFDHAEGQAQGAGGIGIVAGAFEGVAGVADLGMGLAHRFALGFDHLADGAGLGIHQPGQFDHGVFGLINGRLAALI